MNCILKDQHDLLSDDFLNDPYPTFHRLRHDDPIYWSEQIQAWLVTPYDDVVNCLTNPLVSANRIAPRIHQFSSALQEKYQPLSRALSMWPLMLDPPAHSRLRTLINKAMTASIIESFIPWIKHAVGELLDAAESGGEMDLIAGLAYPLPLNVVSELIGIPSEGRPLVKECAVAIVNFFGCSPDLYPERAEAAANSISETNAYLRTLLNERRSVPARDLITSLAYAEVDDDRLDDEEILAACLMMVFAGFETTTNLIGNGIYTLLRHPEEYAKLRRNPALMRNAIKEMLRFEAPVQRLSRMALADFDMHGRTVREGDLMFLMVASANRDADYFADPDRFDIERDAAKQLSFGHSIHTCPGNTLAQIEMQIVCTELLRRFPKLSLPTDRPDWQRNLSVRSLNRLPVLLD